MADYLETYAARFDLSVRIGTHVDSITKIEDRFLVSVNDHSFEADNVVLATGGHPGSEPTRPGSLLDRLLTLPFWFFLSRVASVTNPVGRRMRPQMIKTTLPLVRVKPKDLDAAGVVRVPGTVAVRDGRPILEDGRVLDVRNVGWCTGYRSVFDWIEVDVLDQEGRPMHERGTTAEPGLYFVGLFFLSSLASSLVGGVGRDASYIARHIAAPFDRLRAHRFWLGLASGPSTRLGGMTGQGSGRLTWSVDHKSNATPRCATSGDPGGSDVRRSSALFTGDPLWRRCHRSLG